jgi:hypothetical protein
VRHRADYAPRRRAIFATLPAHPGIPRTELSQWRGAFRATCIIEPSRRCRARGYESARDATTGSQSTGRRLGAPESLASQSQNGREFPRALRGRSAVSLGRPSRDQQKLERFDVRRDAKKTTAHARRKPAPAQTGMPTPSMTKETITRQFRRQPRHPINDADVRARRENLDVLHDQSDTLCQSAQRTVAPPAQMMWWPIQGEIGDVGQSRRPPRHGEEEPPSRP